MPSQPDAPLPTLEDVARRAGVSTATVSRVLNAPDRVRAETRERVRRIVDELGYTPNFSGRALASRRTRTVGAIIPTMENAIFARGLQALQEGLAAADVTLLVATSDYSPAREAEQLRVLVGRGVDGVVLIGEARDPGSYDLLLRRGLPFVLVWTWRPDCPWPCVGFDNRAAARAMAERVLALGHRRIAMIAGVTAGNDRAAARVAGVRDALAGGPAPAIVEAAYTLEAGMQAGERLLAADPRPTVLICGNDVLAAGAYRAAHRAGLSIPGELSVTGFDDIDLAVVLAPQLTTVHVPHRRMGQATAELMLRQVGGEGARDGVEFQTEIVERRSLAPPPSSA